MVAYYNEIDPFAAQWLRNLIAAGHIAPGDVDERSIEDVAPNDLIRFGQCHFFAGVGVWSHALRLAKWDDRRPVWTASCPCQPFSAAGKGAGFADKRHLWPALHHLIGERRPPVVFGEQVEGRDGLAWLDLVQADMEDLGYACGAVVAPAAGFGAPHIRHRTYWVAYADDKGPQGRNGGELRQRAGQRPAGPGGAQGGLGDADGRHAAQERQSDDAFHEQRTPQRGRPEFPAGLGAGGGACDGLGGAGRGGVGHTERPPAVGAGPTNGVWRDADWLYCRDDKWRPVEPGAFPLADGVAGRVGRLRAYGNAIVAPQAAAFIEAAMEHIP